MYGGQAEWGRNLEVARAIGLELERVVIEPKKELQDEDSAGLNDGLTPIHTKGPEDRVSQA